MLSKWHSPIRSFVVRRAKLCSVSKFVLLSPQMETCFIPRCSVSSSSSRGPTKPSSKSPEWAKQRKAEKSFGDVMRAKILSERASPKEKKKQENEGVVKLRQKLHSRRWKLVPPFFLIAMGITWWFVWDDDDRELPEEFYKAKQEEEERQRVTATAEEEAIQAQVSHVISEADNLASTKVGAGT